jgi:hypothetical protein
MDQLCSYLAALGGAMHYDRHNYAGPSGINVPELLQIQERLLSAPESTDEKQHRAQIVRLVAEVQGRRVKGGFPLVGQATRLIQELTVVFGLQNQGQTSHS